PAPPEPPGGWPTISVVTPNFNYGGTVEATLRSVLAQRYPRLQHVVVDGGSTDDSLDRIARYRPHLSAVLTGSDRGQYPAINEGFAAATGDVCGWLNSDDIYLPWTLWQVGLIFATFPQIQWITGRPTQIQDGVIHDVGAFRPYPREFVRAGLYNQGDGGFWWIQQESCFWRRGLWEKVGGLDPSYPYAADFDLWQRFAAHADLCAVSTVLGGFSFRGGHNRSAANWDKYVADVRRARAASLADPATPHAVAARELERYRRLKRIPVVRSVAWRRMKLRELSGPTLTWDFDRSVYRLATARFYT
ncbi:MAG TPA: glycosyltransferase family 2 protein, partial [Tepidisphaeraceae bacterium]|nr:glycosyltransferase family 2 protein [Tepidisphaeraceae bacterium]